MFRWRVGRLSLLLCVPLLMLGPQLMQPLRTVSRIDRIQLLLLLLLLVMLVGRLLTLPLLLVHQP